MGITTKRLHVAIHSVHPHLPLFPIRRLGTISSDFVSLARVTIPDRDSYKVEWNLGFAKDKKVDMEVVVRAMAADEKERPAIEWG